MISLEICKRIIAQSPKLLAFGARVYARELVFVDEYGEHRWRAMASDSPTAHGMDPTFVLVDEGWQLHDYELLEAVSLGPQRACPLQLWTSYAGLRSQMVTGQPLYDLYQAAMDQSDPKLLGVYRHGLEAYTDLPPGFIREGYLDEQRRMLPKNRFERLHLNEWGARDVAAFSDEEIARATRADLQPAIVRDDQMDTLSIDYGRTHDHTAWVRGRRIGAERIQVRDAGTLQGSPEQPITLDLVEALILDQARRFMLHRIVIDPFQMLGTAERCAKILGLPLLDTERADAMPCRAIVLRPIGPAYLNRLTMALLALFRSGTMEIPAALVDLLAQLGSVVTKETFYGVRIDSGAGVGVRAHDDLVISLGMMAIDAMARQPARVQAGAMHVEWLV